MRMNTWILDDAAVPAGDRQGLATAIGMNEALVIAGLSPVTITTGDRLRGAIVEAIGQIEDMRAQDACLTLKSALKIRPEPT